MGKVTRITEEFQHFVADLKETFWGDLYGKTRIRWKQFWEAEAIRERSRYLATDSYERAEKEKRRGYRNGYYERDFATRLGTLRIRIARSAGGELSAGGAETIPAAQRGSADADSGGIFAGDFNAASGASGGDHHRRRGERAGGVEAESEPGQAGEGVPGSEAEG